jgi:predicted dehydrogenase
MSLRHAIRSRLPGYEAKRQQAKREAQADRQAARDAVQSWRRSERPGPKERVRIGFVGAGAYAQHHLKALASYEEVELEALLTTGGPAAAETAGRYGIATTHSDRDAFLAEDVDAYVVVVPPAAMVEVASACLATGRPTLLEKPPGVSSADTEALLRTATTAGTWGMVGMNRRFYSIVDHGLAALARTGSVRGAMVEIPLRITPDRQAKRLTEFDYDHFYVRNAIHGVDLLRYVLGDPVRVHSLTWPNAGHANRAATYAALLEYENGVVGSLVDLWDTPQQTRLKLVTENAWAEWEPPDTGYVADRKGTRRPIPVDPVDTEFRAGIWAQDLHFVEAVRSGREPAYPAATLADMVGTMRLMESILAGTLDRA